MERAQRVEAQERGSAVPAEADDIITDDRRMKCASTFNHSLIQIAFFIEML